MEKHGTAYNIIDRLTIVRIVDDKNEKAEEKHPNFSDFCTNLHFIIEELKQRMGIWVLLFSWRVSPGFDIFFYQSRL